MCVEGQGRSGLTQDIEMGSCVFQCDIPHQWIAQRHVGPMSVYYDWVGVSCPVHGGHSPGKQQKVIGKYF